MSARAYPAVFGVALISVALALAATASGSTESSAAIPGCTPATLPVKSPGKLTLATDNPAPRPWWNGAPQAPWKTSSPYTGKGYESAVAYAVAKLLGFPKAMVTWMPLEAAQATKPGTKAFDLYLGQVSPTRARERDVDFSNGYYVVPQALMASGLSPVAGVRKISQLSHTYLGAPSNSPSLRYIVRYIRPRVGPMIYDAYETALPALQDGRQIQGLVVDLPSAYRYRPRTAGTVIVGQFPLRGDPKRFAFVLEQGSPLRRCVNTALARLWANGTIKKLQHQWLTPAGGGRLLR